MPKFYIGQRVVLPNRDRPMHPRSKVEFNKPYTVVGWSHREPAKPHPVTGYLGPGMILAGVPHGRRRDGALRGYDPTPWEPVCDRETDISEVKKLLQPEMGYEV